MAANVELTKFGRRCSLSLEALSSTIDRSVGGVVASPDYTPDINLTIPEECTVEFEVVRRNASSSQTANFRIYNLGEKTRKLIYKDSYRDTVLRAIQFRAGYKDFMPMIFNGFIRQAQSERVGSDMITTIECYDGGLAMANGFTSITVTAGVPVREILTTLAKSLSPTYGAPIIGGFEGSSSRPRTLFGNTWGIITQEAAGKGGLAMIDSGQVKVLKDNEALQAEIPVINSASGLLGSPRREGEGLQFEMLFEPRLTLGALVQLESSTVKFFNGTYKVMGFTHRGTISPAKGGDCKSTVNLWLGTRALTIIVPTP